MDNRNWVRGAALALLMAIMATASVLTLRGVATSQPTDAVEVGIIDGGTGRLVRMVIEKYRLDARNGLQVKWVPYSTPAVGNSLFALGKFPVYSSMNPTALVRFRNEGKDIVAVWSSLKLNLYVVVKKESPYMKLADLRGKRLGITGWTTDSTVALVSLARQLDRLDLKKDFNAVVAAPPALVGLLEKGEVDAIYIYEPFVMKLLLSGRYRQVMDAGAEWERVHGQPFLMSTIGVYESYAKSNPAVVRKVVATWKDAFELISRKPDVLYDPDLLKRLDLERTPETEKLLRERVSTLFPNRFDAELVKSVSQQIRDAVQMGLVGKERDDWYRLEYVPR